MPIYTDGRPDFECWGRGKQFGVTRAKTFPKYAFSRAGMLMHKIVDVRLHWWEVCDKGHRLVRLDKPNMFAQTGCGQTIFLKPGRGHTCTIPLPDAVLCGRCHGEGPVFPKSRPHKVSKQYAKDHLGCVIEI